MSQNSISTETIRDLLTDALSEILVDTRWADLLEVENLEIRTFAQAELLTSDEGLVVRINDNEFQLTITRSK
jgi:hypothetical protein